jgi:hypothetical protein
MRLVSVLCLASLVAQRPALAQRTHPQTHRLVGEWTVLVPTTVQVNGGQRTEGLTRGTLNVTPVVDSLVATLALE